MAHRSDLSDPRRCRPVRLTDVPEQQRLTAARIAVRAEWDPQERQAILFAALFPSDTVYFIAESRAA